MAYETVNEIKRQRDSLLAAAEKILKRVDQASRGLPSGDILDKDGAAVPISAPLLRELRRASNHKMPLIGDILKELALETGLVKEGFIEPWYRENGPVGAARAVGYHLWYTQAPEDHLTRLLRRQLKHLEEHGHWEEP